ncbi:hypothetical protein [Acinetobacter junii]|nr:hypothetical protein [Acinetobacter junii]
MNRKVMRAKLYQSYIEPWQGFAYNFQAYAPSSVLVVVLDRSVVWL